MHCCNDGIVCKITDILAVVTYHTEHCCDNIYRWLPTLTVSVAARSSGFFTARPSELDNQRFSFALGFLCYGKSDVRRTTLLRETRYTRGPAIEYRMQTAKLVATVRGREGGARRLR
jgi:hypothetical protein